MTVLDLDLDVDLDLDNPARIKLWRLWHLTKPADSCGDRVQVEDHVEVQVQDQVCAEILPIFVTFGIRDSHHNPRILPVPERPEGVRIQGLW